MRKDVAEIRPEDFAAHPVWEFVCEAESTSDTLLEPVDNLPVATLDGRVVGTTVRLANGTLMPATLNNVDLDDPSSTSQFLSLSVYGAHGWLHLARHFDVDYECKGPAGFAAALNLSIPEVFPVVYDLRDCCTGNPLCVAGSIAAEPAERLSTTAVIARTVR